MVAISLYRGKLHQVPGVPRRWEMPLRVMTVTRFKFLRYKRQKAIRSLVPPKPPVPSSPDHKQEDAIGCDGAASGTRLGEPKVEKEDAGVATCVINCSGEVKNEVSISISERINGLEKKLDVLNEKKHNLVQMLKQIINAEEDMKKRMYFQSSVPRPPIPPQTEVSPESGSGSRHVAPRLNVEVNFGSDQAGDSGYPSSHSTHAHTQPWTSPSAFSPQSRPLHGSFLHNLGLPVTRTGSLSTIDPQTSTPSPRAALAHQGHPVNLPPISLSGAQYMTSSSSPASAEIFEEENSVLLLSDANIITSDVLAVLWFLYRSIDTIHWKMGRGKRSGRQQGAELETIVAPSMTICMCSMQ